MKTSPHRRFYTSPVRERIFSLVAIVVVVSLGVYLTPGQQDHRIESGEIVLADTRVDWIFEPIASQPDPEPPFGLSSASIELPSTIITDAAQDLPLFSYPALIEIELM